MVQSPLYDNGIATRIFKRKLPTICNVKPGRIAALLK